MELLNFLKSKKDQRSHLVERLLKSKAISVKEAALLLTTIENINISLEGMSSGAKIVFGDDNETKY
jgi:hypothetical protein